MIEKMDLWLEIYAKISKGVSNKADINFPGAGAAGSLGFAFNTFLNSTLQSGVELILSETRLEDYIKDADLIITGEGRLTLKPLWAKHPLVWRVLQKSTAKGLLPLQAV